MCIHTYTKKMKVVCARVVELAFLGCSKAFAVHTLGILPSSESCCVHQLGSA